MPLVVRLHTVRGFTVTSSTTQHRTRQLQPLRSYYNSTGITPLAANADTPRCACWHMLFGTLAKTSAAVALLAVPNAKHCYPTGCCSTQQSTPRTLRDNKSIQNVSGAAGQQPIGCAYIKSLDPSPCEDGKRGQLARIHTCRRNGSAACKAQALHALRALHTDSPCLHSTTIACTSSGCGVFFPKRASFKHPPHKTNYTQRQPLDDPHQHTHTYTQLLAHPQAP